MTLKIDKGIPLPERKGRELSEEARLMRMMKKGDSLWIKKPSINVVQMARRYIGKGKYAIRTEGVGTRVWKMK